MARTNLLRAVPLAVLLGVSCLLAGRGASAAGFVGVYIWGGTLEKGDNGVGRLANSVALSLDAGFDTIRIAVGPNVVADYQLDPGTCAGHRSLGCFAAVLLAPPIWTDRRLHRVILTTVDFACFESRGDNGNGCLVAARLSANHVAIEAEYAALLEVLHDRFGERVAVVIDNWEGDNFAYCSDSWRFATDLAGFAAQCRATWPNGQSNRARVAALLQWVGLKDAVATRFRVDHPGFDLAVAAEFNTVEAFAKACPASGACNAETDSVLDAIRAVGGRDWCSWSSYDVEGPPDGRYLEAAETILKACRHLIIGEGGYDQNHFSTAQTRALFVAMDQIRHLRGVAGVVPWHGFDAPGATTRYGLWTADGSPQVIDLLGPLHPAPTP